MRFNKPKPDPKAEWHKWFAWYPVMAEVFGLPGASVGHYEAIWLETILRRIVCDGRLILAEYKPLRGSR